MLILQSNKSIREIYLCELCESHKYMHKVLSYHILQQGCFDEFITLIKIMPLYGACTCTGMLTCMHMICTGMLTCMHMYWHVYASTKVVPVKMYTAEHLSTKFSCCMVLLPSCIPHSRELLLEKEIAQPSYLYIEGMF